VGFGSTPPHGAVRVSTQMLLDRVIVAVVVRMTFNAAQ
jgi:hypothetical protein